MLNFFKISDFYITNFFLVSLYIDHIFINRSKLCLNLQCSMWINFPFLVECELVVLLRFFVFGCLWNWPFFFCVCRARWIWGLYCFHDWEFVVWLVSPFSTVSPCLRVCLYGCMVAVVTLAMSCSIAVLAISRTVTHLSNFNFILATAVGRLTILLFSVCFVVYFFEARYMIVSLSNSVTAVRRLSFFITFPVSLS